MPICKVPPISGHSTGTCASSNTALVSVFRLCGTEDTSRCPPTVMTPNPGPSARSFRIACVWNNGRQSQKQSRSQIAENMCARLACHNFEQFVNSTRGGLTCTMSSVDTGSAALPRRRTTCRCSVRRSTRPPL